MVTLISILTLTGCSTMLKNPMKYILSQDETRQDNSDKDNEAASESADDIVNYVRELNDDIGRLAISMRQRLSFQKVIQRLKNHFRILKE